MDLRQHKSNDVNFDMNKGRTREDNFTAMEWIEQRLTEQGTCGLVIDENANDTRERCTLSQVKPKTSTVMKPILKIWTFWL